MDEPFTEDDMIDDKQFYEIINSAQFREIMQ